MPKKIKLNYSYTFPFISDEDIKKYKTDALTALETLQNKNGAGNNYLGWLDLPDKVLSSNYLNKILDIGNEIYKDADLFICIGIGGRFDKTLIQTGTEQDSVNGNEYYSAWYELLPDQAVRINDISISLEI